MHYAMTGLLLQLILNVGIKFEMQPLRSKWPIVMQAKSLVIPGDLVYKVAHSGR